MRANLGWNHIPPEFLNTNSEDIRDYSGPNKDQRGTWCSSLTCGMQIGNKRGRLVHIGAEFMKNCPKCNQKDFLFFDTVSKKMAELWKSKS